MVTTYSNISSDNASRSSQKSLQMDANRTEAAPFGIASPIPQEFFRLVQQLEVSPNSKAKRRQGNNPQQRK